MSLVLRPHRPAPFRDAMLVAFIVVGALASVFALAPIQTALDSSGTGHSALCHCAHCPGGAACCCSGKVGPCPAP